MAQFSIEIADADVNRVITAICENYRRPTTVNNPDFISPELMLDSNPEFIDNNPEFIDNPESEYQFANRMVRKFLADNVEAYEVRVARAAAIATANTSVSITDPN